MDSLSDRVPLSAVPTMPPVSPLAMPVQDLTRRPALRHSADPDFAEPWRVIAFGLTIGITLGMAYGLALWRGTDGLSLVEIALILLASSTGVWVALAAASALIALVPMKPGSETYTKVGEPLDVALVMPIYHEDPTAVMGAGLAMLRDLAASKSNHRFSLHILSDTRGPTLAEDSAFRRLQGLAPAGFPVWYRCRDENTDRKSGNIADWVRTWGGHYEAMVVLDADSLMGATTILALADEMSGDPTLGLIQTAPQLIEAESLFARAQAFAGAAYGPLLGRGLARWSGDGANFWGHNAIIRVRAFAGSAGLPHLSRGEDSQLIWSHDFVEAALLRRRGWKVRLRPALDESFEETPPSLIDHCLRDRRWCQGNLQHLRLLRIGGLPHLARLHLIHGAASFLVSPVWGLLLIGWTLLCTLQGLPGGWGVLAATYGLLLLPKLLGVGRVLASPELRHSFGGGWVFARSALVELVLSVIYAPIMMVQQTKTILRILCGVTIGWAPQNRNNGQYGLTTLWTFHQVETLLGLVLMGVIAGGLLPWWLVPVAASLTFAVPLSAMSTTLVDGATLSTPRDLAPCPVQTQRHLAMLDMAKTTQPQRERGNRAA